jgi:hypothetical protein
MFSFSGIQTWYRSGNLIKKFAAKVFPGAVGFDKLTPAAKKRRTPQRQ